MRIAKLMTRSEKNRLIATFLGFKVRESKGEDIALYTLLPPTNHASSWHCNYSLDEAVHIVALSEEQAWEAHCPDFFFSDMGLRIISDWLFENKYNIVHTQGSKLGIRKSGLDPENGVYINTKSILKDEEFIAAYGLEENIYQACIATLRVCMITRYNADEMAKKARGVTPTK